MLHSVPKILRPLYGRVIWNFPNEKEKIFLTFDDGPNPESTNFILNILKKYDVKATFFCLGEKILKYPNLSHAIIHEGHTQANHGFFHLNAWNTTPSVYLKNTIKGAMAVNSLWFRPPYGKLLPCYARILSNKKIRIILWDFFSFDYSSLYSAKEVLTYSLEYAQSGSVMVFHDNPTIISKLEYIIPRLIEILKSRGISIASIPPEPFSPTH